MAKRSALFKFFHPLKLYIHFIGSIESLPLSFKLVSIDVFFGFHWFFKIWLSHWVYVMKKITEEESHFWELVSLFLNFEWNLFKKRLIFAFFILFLKFLGFNTPKLRIILQLVYPINYQTKWIFRIISRIPAHILNKYFNKIQQNRYLFLN